MSLLIQKTGLGRLFPVTRPVTGKSSSVDLVQLTDLVDASELRKVAKLMKDVGDDLDSEEPDLGGAKGAEHATTMWVIFVQARVGRRGRT